MQATLERTVSLVHGAAAHLFLSPSWEGAQSLELLKTFISNAIEKHPNITFMIMAETPEADILFRSNGLDSIWCNKNAFVDGRIFNPDINAEKKYDAVYLARLVPFKRHELAVEVPHMAVISKNYEIVSEYASSCIKAYKDLQFVNYDEEHGVTELAPSEVRTILTQSRCGLALSAKEGAMWASVEYLLSGLPVVTTASTGGRDVFFDPDYVEVVEDTPEAVAAGVARIIARDINPQLIRDRTFQLFMAHRSRLIMRLSGLAQKDLFTHAGPNLWLPQFINKLETWVD